MIELQRVSRFFRHENGSRIRAVQNVSIRIHSGEYICVTGASGTGKTTLINILGCLDQPSRGIYRFAGQDLAMLKQDSFAFLRRDAFGFVFQSQNLLESLTVLENVELRGLYAGLERDFRRKRALDLLAALGLSDRVQHYPTELSGGEQQRVSIARALMHGRIILADEPTSALDAENSERVLEILERLPELGHTLVIVSHNPAIATRAGRRIQLHKGRITDDDGQSYGAVSSPKAPPVSQPAKLRTSAGILEATRAAWLSFRTNVRSGQRLRTSLTLMSILVSVWFGATALSLGEGTYRKTTSAVNRMGLEAITVFPYNVLTGQRGRLTLEDAAAIEEAVPNVRGVSPSIYRPNVPVRLGDAVANVVVEGFVDIGSVSDRGTAAWRLDRGAFITKGEDDNLEQVAVISSEVREQLFPSAIEPIGKHVLIDNQPFRIKGVLQRRSGIVVDAVSTEVQDELERRLNSRVFIPFQTGAALLFGSRELQRVTVFLHDPEKLFEAADDVRDVLLRRYEAENFTIDHTGEGIKNAELLRNRLWLSLGAAAGVALLGGGLGVTGLMMSLVSTRAREIGVRLAMGATRKNILQQFLTESIITTMAGGLLGAIASVACFPAYRFFDLPVAWSPRFVAIPFICAVVVGSAFGISAAYRASQVDPAAALAED